MKRAFIALLFALATSTPYVAHATSDNNLPPGANPPGNSGNNNGLGCLDNPGVGCKPNKGGNDNAVPPGSNPPGNGGDNNGKGCLDNPGVGCNKDKGGKPPPPPAPAPGPVTSGSNSNSAAQAAAVASAQATAQAGATSTLNGKVEGTNTLNNAVNVEGAKTNIGPVSSGSTSGVTGSGNNSLNLKVDAMAGAGGSGTGGSIGAVSPTATASGNGSGNTLRGGDSSASATGNGAGNKTEINNTEVTTYKRVTVEPMFNPTPASVSSSAQTETRTLACGPLARIVKDPVSGVIAGFFTNTEIPLGYDMKAEPFVDANGQAVMYEEAIFEEEGDKIVRRFGHQLTITSAVPNVAGAKTLQIGFAGSSSAGNAGGGASSSVQRIVQAINVQRCEVTGYRLVKQSQKVVTGLTKEELLSALTQVQLRMDVPTDRVVEEKIQCKEEVFTNAKGEKFTSCKGPKGSYTRTRVIREKATGTLSITPTLKSEVK